MNPIPAIPVIKSRRRIAFPRLRTRLDLACNLLRSNHEIETSEMGFNGQFCIAKISSRACLLRVLGVSKPLGEKRDSATLTMACGFLSRRFCTASNTCSR